MRHVVIVGATDGIGLALAREYAGRSWRVAVVGRDAGKVQGVVDTLAGEHPGGTVVGGVLDVMDRGAVVSGRGPAASGRAPIPRTTLGSSVHEWCWTVATKVAGESLPRETAIPLSDGTTASRGKPVSPAISAA